jgi:hypothetical protein
MAAGRVQVWVEIASVAFGEAQAFASDDVSDRRAWLRARKGDLVRGLVFDRGSYPLSAGKLTPKEPRFPRPGATPGDDDVRKMARAWSVDPRDIDFRKPGILGTRDTTIRLPKKEGESGKEFFGRTGIVYLQHRWDDDAYDGPATRMTLPGFSFCWPRAWKKPATAGDGTQLWSLPEGKVTFQALRNVSLSPDSASFWIGTRERMLAQTSPGWLVMGGKKIHHDFGVGMETGEILTEEPRATRALRFLFAPPWMFVMSLTCPDEIPHARGRELASLFYSVCLQPIS